MDAWLIEHLACPSDRTPLRVQADELRCDTGHVYPCVAGIPVLLVEDARPTLPSAWEAVQTIDQDAVRALVEHAPANGEVEPFVQEVVAATNGLLYVDTLGKLQRYPIPNLRLPPSPGARLLDVGCNWGRWCVSAGRLDYRPVGLDPNLRALVAARRVAHQLGIEASFVCGDARYLPFRDASFNAVFSYSVIQHFSKADARDSVREMGRVLAPGASSLVQMPNKFGIRSAYHQARLKNRPVEAFDVRYWSPGEIQRVFADWIGPTRLSVDGFFGLGIQASDIDIVPPRLRPVITTSEALRKLASRQGFGWLVNVADSVYAHSTKTG